MPALPDTDIGEVHQLAENQRTRVRASIRRATTRAHRDMHTLDRVAAAEVYQIYKSARDDLQARILDYAGSDGSLRLEAMQALLDQVNQRLSQLNVSLQTSLEARLLEAARIGVDPLTRLPTSAGVDFVRVPHEAVLFTRNFIAADGLQLTDRWWRIDRSAKEQIGQIIQSHIIQGHSASQAAQEFLASGLVVPADVQSKQRMSSADMIAKAVAGPLLSPRSSPYAHALRLFRTEINRAHGEAYMRGAQTHPDVAGFRYLLSPNHPRPDICDLHANVNRYGLGKGVYPSRERCPWPAHPNTLSFVVVVFKDEITPGDRESKETRLDWLKRQSPAIQEQVLNSRWKRVALEKGYLTEGSINTPWAVLYEKLTRKGVDVRGWKLPPPPQPKQPPPAVVPKGPYKVPADNAQAARYAGSFDQAPDQILNVLNRYHAPIEHPSESGYGAYHLQGGIMMGKVLDPGTPDGRRAWRHEYGHFIDYQLRSNHYRYRSAEPDGWAALKADNNYWKSQDKAVWRQISKFDDHMKALYKGRRYSKTNLNSARDEITDRLSEIYSRDQMTQHMESSDSFIAKLWRLQDDTRKGYTLKSFFAADKFDDLGVLATSFPAAHDSYVNIMDMVGSITLNRVGRGHSVQYYRDRPEHGQPAEAFANVFDLLSYGDEGIEAEILDKFAPSFSQFVREVISDD